MSADPKTTRDLLRALAESLADALEGAENSGEYYDQKTSPLPTTTYLKLVRRGLVTGYKCHGRVLVRRADLHSYIERHRVEPRARPLNAEQILEGDEEAAELRRLLGEATPRKAG